MNEWCLSFGFPFATFPAFCERDNNKLFILRNKRISLMQAHSHAHSLTPLYAIFHAYKINNQRFEVMEWGSASRSRHDMRDSIVWWWRWWLHHMVLAIRMLTVAAAAASVFFFAPFLHPTFYSHWLNAVFAIEIDVFVAQLNQQRYTSIWTSLIVSFT